MSKKRSKKFWAIDDIRMLAIEAQTPGLGDGTVSAIMILSLLHGMPEPRPQERLVRFLKRKDVTISHG